MPPRRRPTELGPVPAPKGSALPAHESVEVDDERTTVDGGPGDSGWEEQTVAESATPRRTPPRGPERRGGVNDEMITVDTTAEPEEEEATVRARSEEMGRLADGTGESSVDEGTLDEMTVEEQARPLPPVSRLPAPQPRRDPTDCRFVIESGNDAGRTLMLAGASISVGRGIDNDLVLTDIAVSRRHFEVSFSDGRYTLRDLGSGNGTLINDRVEDGVCHLRHGDRIEFGNTVIRVDHPATKDEMPKIGWGGQDDDDEPSTIAAQPRAKVARGGTALPASAQPRRKKPTLPPPVPSKLVLPPTPPGAAVEAPAVGAPVASSLSYDAPVHSSSSDSGFPFAADLVAMPVDGYGIGGRMPTQLRPADNKVLIWVVGVSVAIVMVAIGITVVRGGDDGPPLAAAAPGESAGPEDAPPAGSMAAPEPIKSAVPAPATTGDEPQGAASTATSPRIAMATTKPKTAASDLPVTTWGTSEQPLAATFAKLPKRKAAPPVPAPKPATKASPPARTKPAAKPPKRGASVHGPGHKRIVARRKRVAAARVAPRRTRSPGLATTKKKALAEYRKRRFSAGATLLRRAAKNADNKTATALRTMAGNYDRVATELGRAQSNEVSNAVVAMGAYRRALAIDRSASGGAHATYIRIKLGAVAPKAAAAYMVGKRYEAAKRACDAAVNYGAGSHPTVRRVRSALSRKAAAFYSAAAKSYKGNPNYAKKLLRRAIAMVPADDPSYAKSYRLLNQRAKRGRDDDE